MSNFTHLHVHTHFSLPIGKDGYNSPKTLVETAAALNMDTLAITDHGSMYALVDFHKAAKDAGIKPVYGMEAYISSLPRDVKNPTNKKSYHGLLLAQNMTGYKNLLQLTTIAHCEGFYNRPRVDHAALEEFNEGLIATSACMSGEILVALIEGEPVRARQLAAWYRDVFKDRFYLELQYHPAVPQLDDLNTELARIGTELGIPLVVTSDVHFATPNAAEAHRFLKASRYNKTVDEWCVHEPILDDSFSLLTVDQLWPHFKRFGVKPFENTRVISEQCKVDLKFGNVTLPAFAIPAPHTAETYLKALAEEGLENHGHGHKTAYRDRLYYELDVINQTGFPDYMLIVWDMVRFARSRGIPSLPRGSAGASLVLYCLGISDVDPIVNGLLFERFLSPERLEMPDIDIDFADSRRAEVVEYLALKYGRDNTAQIMTVGRLGVKAALRDAARTIGMPLSHVDQLAKMVPGKAATVEAAFQLNPDMEKAVKGDTTYQELVQKAKWILGRVKSIGTHACGIVISREPLREIVPLMPTKDGGLMAAFEGTTLAEIGLLKLDALGLTNLSVLADTLAMITEKNGTPFTLHDIPLDDKAVFKSLGEGHTRNVFQLESDGMTRYLMELKPTHVGDLYAMVALYRPGPLEQVPLYIKNKNNPDKVKYMHPLLESILKDTYGVIVYQEQIMLLLQAIAGYTLGEAYIVLKAIGKKKQSLMDKEEPRFKNGCVKQGLSQHQADTLWNLIQPFAGYSFNRPHSTLYGLLSYQTAWLKEHYPAEYMVATLTHDTGDIEKVASACAESERLGIAILPPSVNESIEGFAIIEKDGKPVIRFGMCAVKDVGRNPVGLIKTERAENGPFTSLKDFVLRTDRSIVSKKVIEALVKAGACDDWGIRQVLLEQVPQLLKDRIKASNAAKKAKPMTRSFFEDMPLQAVVEEPIQDVPDTAEWRMERLNWEREFLGFYLSAHPVKEVLSTLKKVEKNWLKLGSAPRISLNMPVSGIALIQTGKRLVTKKGDAMAVLELSDETGNLPAVVFPKTYAETDVEWLYEDTIVGYRGKLSLSQRGELQVLIDQIGPLETAKKAPPLHYRPVETIMVENDEEEVMLMDVPILPATEWFEEEEADQPPDFQLSPDYKQEPEDMPLEDLWIEDAQQKTRPAEETESVEETQDTNIMLLMIPRDEDRETRKLLAHLAAVLRSCPEGEEQIYLGIPSGNEYIIMQAGENWKKTISAATALKIRALGISWASTLPPMSTVR